MFEKTSYYTSQGVLKKVVGKAHFMEVILNWK
nr:MAG TPA: hypothetical protein [Caudoviricetes sp.]DAU13801.1 MAG TPA: hypothetical protein [Caudoviricetes sp.]